MTEGLVVLWEASDRVCGKRLKALLPTLVPALERHGHVTLDPRVREQLMAVSAATIDRRLASARAVTAGQRRRRRSGGDSVRGRVPVRTFGDWQDPVPGFVEADLVAHCGSSMAGSFVWTLVLTDIASGWTECVPLLVRAAGVVVDAVDRLRGALPFPLRGIDTDNGSEFLNEVLIGFCKEHGIELTRTQRLRTFAELRIEVELRDPPMAPVYQRIGAQAAEMRRRSGRSLSTSGWMTTRSRRPFGGSTVSCDVVRCREVTSSDRRFQ